MPTSTSISRSKGPKWSLDDIGDQARRVALVTGANTGLGLETARALAGLGARVILACRDAKRGAAAASELGGGRGSVTVLPLDLSSLAGVESASIQVIDTYDRLDLLINNAGVMAPPRQLTEDGFELQFGTNHLGHFALTARLSHLLCSTPDARVVTVSSLAHREGRLDLSDLGAEDGYDAWACYQRSKLANLVFAIELDRRLRNAGSTVRSVASHPGLSNTNLFKGQTGTIGGLVGLFRPIAGLFMQSPQRGALTTLRAALDPTIEGGCYVGPSGPFQAFGRPVLVEPEPRALDEKDGARLWNRSVGLTGVDLSVAPGDPPST